VGPAIGRARAERGLAHRLLLRQRVAARPREARLHPAAGDGLGPLPRGDRSVGVGAGFARVRDVYRTMPWMVWDACRTILRMVENVSRFSTIQGNDIPYPEPSRAVTSSRPEPTRTRRP